MSKIAVVLWMLIAPSMLTPLYAADLEVTGIRLGMSVTAAEKVIGTGFKFEHLASQDPHVAAYKAVSADGNEGYLLLTLNNKLYYVGHGQRYPDPSKATNHASLKAALIAKYGPPEDQDVVSGGMGWMYDAVGNPVTRQTQNFSVLSMKCPLSPGFTMGVMNVGNSALQYPIAFSGMCNIGVRAEITSMANPALVSYYDVVLWNYQPMFRYLEAKEEASKKAAAAAAAAAKKNTPHL